jgi:hypothetical protein
VGFLDTKFGYGTKNNDGHGKEFEGSTNPFSKPKAQKRYTHTILRIRKQHLGRPKAVLYCTAFSQFRDVWMITKRIRLYEKIVVQKLKIVVVVLYSTVQYSIITCYGTVMNKSNAKLKMARLRMHTVFYSSTCRPAPQYLKIISNNPCPPSIKKTQARSAPATTTIAASQ